MDSPVDYHVDDGADRRWSCAFPWLTRIGHSQQLRDLLEQAEAAHRTSAMTLRSLGREDQARQAERSAAWVRLELEEPEVARRLYQVTRDLRRVSRLGPLLDRILDGAMRLVDADRGSLQIFDAVTGAPRPVAQRGSGAWSADPATILSAPLVGTAGERFGVVSADHPRPRPPERDRRVMRRFGELAGAVIADHLAAAAPGRDGDPLTRAVTTALACQEGLAQARSMVGHARR